MKMKDSGKKWRAEYEKAGLEKRAKMFCRLYGLDAKQATWRTKGDKIAISDWAIRKMLLEENIDITSEVIYIDRHACALRGFATIGGERVSRIVYASATADNCQAKYYPEMAEKRLRGRAGLDALAGFAYGRDYYSEDELSEHQPNEDDLAEATILADGPGEQPKPSPAGTSKGVDIPWIDLAREKVAAATDLDKIAEELAAQNSERAPADVALDRLAAVYRREKQEAGTQKCGAQFTELVRRRGEELKTILDERGRKSK